MNFVVSDKLTCIFESVDVCISGRSNFAIWMQKYFPTLTNEFIFEISVFI